MLDREIQELFETRVSAIRNKSHADLQATQLSEIAFAGSVGYLSLKELDIDVLYTHQVSEIERLALVREVYDRSESHSRSAFILYRLTNTVQGWRIFGTY